MAGASGGVCCRRRDRGLGHPGRCGRESCCSRSCSSAAWAGCSWATVPRATRHHRAASMLPSARPAAAVRALPLVG